MKFTVKINGEAVGQVDAKNASDAVDKARAAHKPALEGGDYEFELSTAETWKDQPPGVVSSFSVRHEPHESVREKVDADRAAKEAAYAKAAEREALKAELRKEIEAEQTQVTSAEGKVSK